MEVTKNRPSLEKFWYEWHGWLTRYIPEYFHKSASNVKKKKKKKNHGTFWKEKPKNIESTFDDKYIKYKSEGNEKPTIMEYLENRPYLNDMVNNL